ncbi:hypothetical protein BGZ99_005111 [Dissophora globulifera]|uniref:D-lactate dehydratase n=1 Tax=Dissophora globulifera TaxID=979702 RepID=A0A9P6UU52_9FUNG|nr:hypothetical protein BGZ99_005111 [Dissophora globulifera]
MADNDNKRALVLITDGTEEMEAVIAIDVLVRGGIDVVVASTNAVVSDNASVRCSRGVQIVPDTHLISLPLPAEDPADDCTTAFDLLFIPGGGPGAKAMAASPLVHQWVQAHFARPGSLVGAVCAAPTVLKAAGVAKGAKVTSHPSVRDELVDYFEYQDNVKGPEIVVKDGKLLTSRGPGSTFELALRLVEELRGKDVMESVRAPMMFP